MCPSNQLPSSGAPSPDDERVRTDNAESEGDTPRQDPLDHFAVAAVQQQAAERGDDEVDMSFVTRALAESRRMRGEADLSVKKREDLAADLRAHLGHHSTQVMQAAMAEHAAEVFVQPTEGAES